MIAVSQAAEHHNATQLLQVCIGMMVQEYPVIIEKEDFDQLSPTIVKNLRALREKFTT